MRQFEDTYFVRSWRSSCRNTWRTCHARPASCRNGRACCAISIACSKSASAIAAMTGWFAPTSPSRSPIYSATPASRCRRAPSRWRHRNSYPPRNPLGNVAVAPGVVPRHGQFRRKPLDINALQNSSVQVGSWLPPYRPGVQNREHADSVTRLRGIRDQGGRSAGGGFAAKLVSQTRPHRREIVSQARHEHRFENLLPVNLGGSRWPVSRGGRPLQ